MNYQPPYILELSDDELAPYSTIIQTLARRPYHGENITEQVVSDIQALAQTDQPTIRVAQSLIGLLQDDRSVPRLIAALPERSLSYPAALLLGWFGSRAQSAVPALIEAIGWGPTIGVGAAATAVVQIAGDPDPLIDGLTRSLHDANDDAFVQLMGVAEALGLHTHARFIQALDSATRNRNPAIREWTADVIGRLPGGMRILLGDAIARLTIDEEQQVQEAIRAALQS
jgi:HEAT repeat protein